VDWESGDKVSKPTLHRDAKLLRVETFIGNVLRYGVYFCASIIALGLVESFVMPQKLQPPLSEFLPQLLQGAVFQGGMPSLVGTNPNAVIAMGLLLLIALPVIRVFLTLAIFIVEKDIPYIFITATVLAILVFGLVFGKAI
jgi:uncharacterized membrane protein